MKNLIKYSVFAFLLSFLSFSCKEKEEFPTVLEMKLVDGSWISETYLFPKNTHFLVRTSQGSYYLEYSIADCKFGYKNLQGESERCSGIVRAGVIDYRIINSKLN